MIFWELKKMLKSKTGLIAIALFVFLCGVIVFVKPVLETENFYRNDKYELVADRRPGEEIAQEKFNNKIAEIETMANLEGNDPFSLKIREMSQEKLKSIKSKAYKDVSFFKVFNHRAAHPLVSFIIVIISVLIFSNIYTDEIISGMDNIILSSKNKFKVLYSKLGLAIILPIVLYGSYLIIVFLVTLGQHGTPVNGGFEAFRIVDNGSLLNGTFTINSYLMLKVGVMMLVFTTIAVFASFFSFITTNSLASISGTLIFIVFGKVCTLMKFLPESLFSVFSKGNYVDIMFYPNQFVGMYFGQVNILGKSLDLIKLCNSVLIAILFVGIALCVLTFKMILNK